MASFLLNNPDAVFLHLPKCAGTSVRALWNENAAAQAFGYLPDIWRGKPVFSIIRNPEKRFLSALRMFKYGNPDHPGYYNKPVWPELTIEMALDVLADDSIPFDRSQRYTAANFKHHIIAQTHPFNCLHKADIILRQENLTQDMDLLAPIFGFTPTLPHLRITGGKTGKIPLTPQQRHNIQTAFAEDYRQLGYDTASGAYGEIRIKKHKKHTLYQAWPFFFSNNIYPPTAFETCLPDDAVDLTVFLQTPIVGQKGGTWPGRSDNLNTHFHNLLPEFVGRSHLAFLLACCIVVIRKSNGTGAGITLFHRIISEHTDEICSELNTRWLVSVCDTLADHGKNGAQKALGLGGSLLANTVKLVETERNLFQVPRPWPPKRRLKHNKRLFDGVIGFWLENGDMIENMIARIETVGKEDPVAGAFVGEILLRLIQFDTVFKRTTQILGQKLPPLAKEERIERLSRLAKRWL
jgi:hypothetical protein